MMATCKRLTKGKLHETRDVREAYGQVGQSAARSALSSEAMSPLHRIERYQHRVFQDRRL